MTIPPIATVQLRSIVRAGPVGVVPVLATYSTLMALERRGLIERLPGGAWRGTVAGIVAAS